MAIEDKVILLKVSGHDKPGVTSGLTVLATYNAIILDIGRRYSKHFL
jgi:phosphoserine phosphatase